MTMCLLKYCISNDFQSLSLYFLGIVLHVSLPVDARMALPSIVVDIERRNVRIVLRDMDQPGAMETVFGLLEWTTDDDDDDDDDMIMINYDHDYCCSCYEYCQIIIYINCVWIWSSLSRKPWLGTVTYNNVVHNFSVCNICGICPYTHSWVSWIIFLKLQ